MSTSAEPPDRAIEAERPARRQRNTVRQREAGAASRTETSRRLLHAAGELFAEHGYSKATVGMIAARAGVSVQTLYLTWSSKRQLLRGYLFYALSGAVEGLADGQWAAQVGQQMDQSVVGEPSDPVAQIRAAARVFRLLAGRTSAAWRVYRDAAAVDDDIDADWVDLARRRRKTMADGLLAATLTSERLRAGMNPEAALDIAMIIMSPESFEVLVRTFGYSLDRYENWMADTLIAALLPDRQFD